MKLKYTFKLMDKVLRFGYVSAAGRNFSGVICVHHKGGGHKRKSYAVDFYRRLNLFGYVSKLINTSFFSGLLALVIYENGISSYILASEGLNIGSRIYSGQTTNINSLTVGSSFPIKNAALFSLVNNIENYPFSGGKLVRAAGASAMVTALLEKQVMIKLKSGWNLKIANDCICTLGLVSNSIHRFIRNRKAGKMRALGIRPTVRGVAMNPCDHPHGGGEGKKSPPAAARSPWGWLTKGTPTNIKKYKIINKKDKFLRN